MAAGTAKPTNEELVERLQAAGEGTPDAAAIMGQLWEQNAGLVRFTIRKVTGLDYGNPGFEDLEQQAFFAVHAAVHRYNPELGCKFSTLLPKSVKWEICRYYAKTGTAIHIPEGMKNRIRACIKKKQQLEAETGRAATYEAALKAMGYSGSVTYVTLSAMEKLETMSLDKPMGEDGDGSLLDVLTGGADVAEIVSDQEWHRALRELLNKALQELPADKRAIIVRRFYRKVPYSQIADEAGVSLQAILNRVDSAFQAIRAGQYGPKLAEFVSTESSKQKADRQIKEDRAAIEKLQLTDDEKGLLAL